MKKTYFRRYCMKCVFVHWVEVTRSNKEICHGADFYPHDTMSEYTKHAPGGGITVIEKITYRRPIDPAFQMLIDEHETTHPKRSL